MAKRWWGGKKETSKPPQDPLLSPWEGKAGYRYLSWVRDSRRRKCIASPLIGNKMGAFSSFYILHSIFFISHQGTSWLKIYNFFDKIHGIKLKSVTLYRQWYESCSYHSYLRSLPLHSLIWQELQILRTLMETRYLWKTALLRHVLMLNTHRTTSR